MLPRVRKCWAWLSRAVIGVSEGMSERERAATVVREGDRDSSVAAIASVDSRASMASSGAMETTWEEVLVEEGEACDCEADVPQHRQ